MHDTPRPLWLSSRRVAFFRELLCAGEPTAVAIHAAARSESCVEPGHGETTSALTAAAVRARVEGDVALAATVAERWISAAETAILRGNLGRADTALAGAAIQDAVAGLVPIASRQAIRRGLRALALSFRVPDLQHGDPHNVTNNHWGVSHAGAAIAAMASHDGSAEATDLVAWARGRTRAYLRLHGDAGLYHEGIGYQLYPGAFWAAFILASRGFDATDELAGCPSLRHTAASLYAMARRTPTGHGAVLSWNDAGGDWCDSSAAVLLAAISPPRQRAALRALYDQLNGVAGDRRFGPRHAGLFFALAVYPFEVQPRAVAKALPRWIVDDRQGFVVVRNRYRDADDAVLGGYARCAHPGGHAHDDAGSLRFAALGHDWIVGGGQNRANAEWQSIVTPADGERPTKPYACGALAWCERSRAGGVFGFDLRRASRAYAERWVAVAYGRERAGDYSDLAVLDMIDDHTGRDWHWNLSFSDGLTFVPHGDGSGFELVAVDGARMSSRFLAQTPARLELLRMPESARTYQHGARELYPGLPFVRAVFPNHPHRAIYWAARVRRGPATTIRLAGSSDADLRLGAHAWHRPFGAGIAATFNPLRGGTPSRYPSGAAE